MTNPRKVETQRCLSMTNPRKITALLSFALTLAVCAGGQLSLAGEANWQRLFLDAKPVLDVRYRFEHVEQQSKAKDANAHTVRTRAGFESGRVYGIGLSFDVEWIEAIGSERFNNTINGKTAFPVVADPDDAEINQLYLIADGTIPGTRFKLGRQRIIWDNQRFIGNVAFRQNEQTFDAFRATLMPADGLELEYAYMNEVRRIFGDDSPVGRLAMNSHGLRASYRGLKPLRITPFALFIDYDDAAFAGLSSATYGMHVGGKHGLGEERSLLYTLSLAYQQDHGDNPGDYGVGYLLAEPGLRMDGLVLKLGYELLEGDGSNAFQTPLATGHKFNGFTDQFLTTPATGLQDLYLAAAYRLPGAGWWSGSALKAAYHQFWSDDGDIDYGDEWDVGIFKSFKTKAGQIEVGLQYARYGADSFSSNTEKLWFTLRFKLADLKLGDAINR